MSRTGAQVDQTPNRRLPIAVPGAETRSNRRHSVVICTGGLAVACASVAVMLASGATSYAMTAHSPSPTMASDMPGMNHGSAGMPTASPSPTMAGDMPGMNHGSAGMPTSSPSPMAADSPWNSYDDSGTAPHDHGSGGMPGMPGTMAGTTSDRPLAPVLGTFGGGTSAVLLTAGFLRRKDRARARAKQDARAARRSQR